MIKLSDWNSGRVCYVSPVPSVMPKIKYDMFDPYVHWKVNQRDLPHCSNSVIYKLDNSKTFSKNKYNLKSTSVTKCA